MDFKLILFNLGPNGLVLDEHFYQAAEIEIRPLFWIKICKGAPASEKNIQGRFFCY
jgi:hypothetical protein